MAASAPPAAAGDTTVALPIGPVLGGAAESALPATPTGSDTGADAGFVPPAYCRCQSPTYPAEAKRRRQEGTVLLRLRVGERGQVEFVSVKDSSGHASLDTAAVRAVKSWLFEPARKNGTPVGHEVEVPVRFALKD